MEKPTLEDLVDNEKTDKNTTHSYLPLYEELFAGRKIKKILEIGVGAGGSIKLWHDYFPEADVWGIDTQPRSTWPVLLTLPRVHLFSANAYDPAAVKLLVPKDMDIVIDDGPNTLECMRKVVELYLPCLKPGGLLIIEDIQAIEWARHIMSSVPASVRASVRVYDRRTLKGRHDDIVFTVAAPES